MAMATTAGLLFVTLKHIALADVFDHVALKSTILAA
jgi:hypothetical protein